MATSDFNLELHQSNMFAYNSRVIVFPDGTKELLRQPLNWTKGVNDREYRLKQGDTLTGIAFKSYYNYDSDFCNHYWWIIADANPSIDNPLDLSDLIGDKILIPDINDVLLYLSR